MFDARAINFKGKIMKATKLALAIFSISVLSAPVVLVLNSQEASSDEVIACAWFPACGDPDIYSPALEPKAATKNVHSVKEEKNSLILVV
jgi:hypothetical protein